MCSLGNYQKVKRKRCDKGFLNPILKVKLQLFRMLRTGIVKKNWSIEDLSIIVWLVVKFGQTNTIPL